MKRIFVFFLVLLLLLTGCTGKEKTNNVSIKDVCCPYEINHKKDMVELTLKDGEHPGVLWRVETIPEDICEVIQLNTEKDDTHQYHLTGKEEGAASLTFTAVQADESVLFVLTLVVDVDSNGKTIVSSYQHQEASDTTVEVDGLKYKWSVELDGSLNFSFINNEDNWNASGDGMGIFTLSNMMSTPAGCKFTAQAKASGQATIILVGENTKRTIHVIIKANDDGKMEVVSVQEQ